MAHTKQHDIDNTDEHNGVGSTSANEIMVYTDDGLPQKADGDIAVGQKLTSVTTPTGDNDVATKGYVDGVAEGLDVKDSVVAATTEAGTLASDYEDGDTIDGVSLSTGDRILLKDQADGTENGIYVVKASGAPDRADDYATGAEVAGAFCFVEDGTENAERGYVCNSDSGSDVVNTDSLSYTQFSGVGDLTAGDGLTKTGDTLDVGAGNGVTANADSITLNPDTTTGATVAQLAVSANGAGVTVDNDTITHTGGTIQAEPPQKIYTFEQAAEPSLSNGETAIWVDTDGGNATYLIHKDESGNQKSVELS